MGETFSKFHCTRTLERFEQVCSNKTRKVFRETFRFWNKIFRSFNTNFSAVDQNCTKRVQGNVQQNYLFLKEHQKIVSIFSVLRFERVVKQPSTSPRDNFWKNCFFFWKKFNFRKSFDFDQKTSGVSEKSFSRVIKTATNVSRTNLRWESAWNLISVFHFFYSWAKNLKFRWIHFHSPSQLFIRCARQQFEAKYVFRVNRIFVFFGALVEILQRGSAEYHSTCSQPFFELLINVW